MAAFAGYPCLKKKNLLLNITGDTHIEMVC